MFAASRFALLLIAMFCLGLFSPAHAQDHSFKTITFKAADGLVVTADLYMAHEDKDTPMVILFHQAGWSRGEYRETAPKLSAMGFNCLAVDQRSGDKTNGVNNETAKAAKRAGAKTDFVSAYQDMEAALAYAHTNHATGKVIVLGSSYSASLVFHLAADHPDKVDALLAFSPGEYFGRQGKPDDWIASAAAKIKCPAFVTSSRNEAKGLAPIYNAIEHNNTTHYTPRTAGQHGSRALWKKFRDHGGYWEAMEVFLKSVTEEK